MNALTPLPAAAILLLATAWPLQDAHAGAASTPPLALALVDAEGAGPALASLPPANDPDCPDGFAVAPSDVPGHRLDSIRYRPRRNGGYYPRERESESRGSSGASGFLQLHGGFFAPEGHVSDGAVFGLRAGTNLEDRVQIGGGVDWSHHADRQSTVVSSGTLPDGSTVTREVDLSRVSSDLVPVLGFVQVSPGGHAGGPYVGLAGGYEALFVSATDFATGADFDATYDGWGWQLYGGFALPIGPSSRFTVEGFTNRAELDRKVDDPSSGLTLREVVEANGAGVRAGVSFGF